MDSLSVCFNTSGVCLDHPWCDQSFLFSEINSCRLFGGLRLIFRGDGSLFLPLLNCHSGDTSLGSIDTLLAESRCLASAFEWTAKRFGVFNAIFFNQHSARLCKAVCGQGFAAPAASGTRFAAAADAVPWIFLIGLTVVPIFTAEDAF